MKRKQLNSYVELVTGNAISELLQLRTQKNLKLQNYLKPILSYQSI